MAKQIGNLEVPKLFETWDNPLWVGEEADKYRNVVKDYGHDYFGNIYDKYSEEDRKLYLSMPHNSITAMRIRLKYGDLLPNRLSNVEKRLIGSGEEDLEEYGRFMLTELKHKVNNGSQESRYYANEEIKELKNMMKEGRLRWK